MSDTGLRVFSIGAVAALALGMAVAWFVLSAGSGAPARIERPPPSAPLTARVTVAADGALRFQDCDGTDRALGRLSDETAAAQALEGLSSELARVASKPRTRDVCGDSNWTLEVDLDGAVPWTEVAWVLQTAYAPPARLYRVRFHRLDSLDQGIDHELPRDPCGPTPAPPLAVHALKVVLTPPPTGHDPAARTAVRAAVVDQADDEAAEPKAEEAPAWVEAAPIRDAMRARFAELKGDAADLLVAVDLGAATPDADVPYRDVDAVLLALRDADLARFRLWNGRRALPGPGR